MNVETEFERQLENLKKAVISQNLAQIMACYAEDIRAFDAVAELQLTNSRKYQDHWQRCLQMCTMTQFEIGQLDINQDGDLAACAFLNQWFSNNAEQAVDFYLSVFGGREIDQLYYNSAGHSSEGSGSVWCLLADCAHYNG